MGKSEGETKSSKQSRPLGTKTKARRWFTCFFGSLGTSPKSEITFASSSNTTNKEPPNHKESSMEKAGEAVPTPAFPALETAFRVGRGELSERSPGG